MHVILTEYTMEQYHNDPYNFDIDIVNKYNTFDVDRCSIIIIIMFNFSCCYLHRIYK